MRRTDAGIGARAVLLFAQLAFVCAAAFAQGRALPPNAPPNPNWAIANWGEPPAGTQWKDLKGIRSITYDPNGTGSIAVLVAPPVPSDPAVWVFDYNGKLQRQWGANLFTHPYDLVVDRFGSLWIIDRDENFITKFTEDGQPLMTIGKKGVAGDNGSHDSFNGPTDVAIAENGDILVTDGYTNSRIVKFDKNGKFLTIIGGAKGAGIGQFNVPLRIAINSKGEVVIVDRMNKRIQFWTQDGKFLNEWTDLAFMNPAGLAITRDDTLYLSDSDGQSIKIVKDDKILDAIGGLDGVRPHQVTVDRFGALYICDEPGRMIRKLVRVNK
jgi:6-bladed beta-propeller